MSTMAEAAGASEAPRLFRARSWGHHVGALALLTAAALAQTPSAPHLPRPRLVLWAWERPTDLRFIDPENVGVAFLAQTLELAGDRVEVRPRLQSLAVPPGTVLTAVVRVETSRHEPPALSEGQRALATAAFARLFGKIDVHAAQIDFDATLSQRRFYRDLVADVRGALPDGMPLSITALASWCLGDPWIEGLPIDDAVPMLFRMGHDGERIRHGLTQGRDFRARLCRTSLGVATDEPIPPRPGQRRLYVFSPGAWSPSSVARLERRSLR